jgi:hypothetical protein
MKGRTIIRADGSVQTEVLEREGQDCKIVQKLTDAIGTQVSEEITGPDCDEVHENTFD